MSKEFESLEPLENRLLVVPVKKNDVEKSDGGIIIPDTAKKEVCRAIVHAVGMGVYARETGELIPTILGKGDEVLCGADANKPIGLPVEIYIDGKMETAYVMRESDVLFRIKKNNPD